MRRGRADYLAYALLDATVDGYFPLLNRMGVRLEEIVILEKNGPRIVSRLPRDVVVRPAE